MNYSNAYPLTGYSVGTKSHALRDLGERFPLSVRYIAACGQNPGRYGFAPTSEPIPITCKRCGAKVAA